MTIEGVIRESLRNGWNFFYDSVMARKGFLVESKLYDNRFFLGSEMEQGGKRYYYIYRFCEGSSRVFKMIETERCTKTGAKIKLVDILMSPKEVCPDTCLLR